MAFILELILERFKYAGLLQLPGNNSCWSAAERAWWKKEMKLIRNKQKKKRAAHEADNGLVDVGIPPGKFRQASCHVISKEVALKESFKVCFILFKSHLT